MTDLIPREEAIKLIEDKQRELCPVGRFSRHEVYGGDREKFDAWQEIIDAIEKIAAVDAVLVAHGKWVYNKGVTVDGEVYPGRFMCDQCKHWVDAGLNRNFCPNCGAKMEVEDDGET